MRQRIAIIILELLLSLVLVSAGALAQGGALVSPDVEIQAYGSPPEGPVVMVGHLGGGVTAVAVQGTTACVGLGARLVTLNISNPDQPVFRGQSGLIPPGVAGIVISSTMAYVAAYDGGVYSVDISDLTKPTIKGHYDDGPDSEGVAVTVDVEGRYLYVAYGANGLVVLNVSDPANLTVAGTYPADENLFYEDVVVVGTLAYATDLAGLVILDVSNPASPTKRGYVDMKGLGKGTSGVVVSGSYAYVAVQLLSLDGTGNTLRVVNIANPASPSEVATLALAGNTGRVAMAGNYVYVSLGADGVQSVDVSTPTSPTTSDGDANRYDTPGNPLILAGDGSQLHVADECGGYRIASLAAPAKPVDRSIYGPDGCATRVAVANNHANINTELGLSVVNVADPALAAIVGRYSVSLTGLAASGNYVYVVDGAGLHVVSIATPSSPTQVGYLALSGTPSAVAVQGSYAYVVGQSGGLKVIDIDPPETPTQVIARSFSGTATGIAVSGGTACVTVGSSGLQMLNIATPTNPTVADTLDTPGTASDVSISGSMAYVADSDGGLRIVDISNTAAVTETGFYTGTTQVSAVVAAGEYAYVADGYNGIALIDVSDPAKPYEFYSYTTPDNSQDIELVGDQLYVADGAGGLLIFKITLPASINHPVGEAWNLFSFNVEPISATVPLTDVQSILLSVDKQYSSVLGFDQRAFSYYPDLDISFSDLLELDWRHGYWIKMNQASALKIKGWPVDPTTPLALAKGWNLVSYLPTEPISVTQALASIDGQYTSVLGFHDGVAVSFYSDLEPKFNDLKCLRPQQGYWIKATTAISLTYPTTGSCTETAGGAAGRFEARSMLASSGAADVKAVLDKDVSLAVQSAPAEQVTPTNLWWDVYSSDTRCAGEPVMEGTIIQAYDPQGVACGYAVAHAPGAWGVMHVYGDDPDTPEDEGAQAGDVITFTMNGKPAQVSGKAVWQERARQEVRLTSSSCGPHNYLPTIQ